LAESIALTFMVASLTGDDPIGPRAGHRQCGLHF
jgi:hypothetical protein